MILDHPYHSLYQVFALAHGDQVNRVSSNTSVVGGFEMNKNRIDSAKQLLFELKKYNNMKQLIIAQEKVILQYIALGNLKIGKVEYLSLKNTPLYQLEQKDLLLVPVSTITIPVRPDCNYTSTLITKQSSNNNIENNNNNNNNMNDSSTISSSNISQYSPVVTISSFDSRITIAPSGVNAPYIIQLLTSEGKLHKQLLKPSDDLRQDAVMEQLFKLVNELLSVHRESAIRQLHVRTYNVIPLTPGVGLVEWVMNTSSLADILTGENKGCHSRYVRQGQKRDYRHW